MWKTLQDRLANDSSYAQRRCHFTKEEFYSWLLSRDDYKRVYAAWVDSNFDRLLVPTLDRLDNDKDYQFDNIQILSWKDNMGKPRKYLTLEERRAAEKRWDQKKRANLTQEQKDRLNALARIRYEINKEKRRKMRRERYALKKKA